MGAEEMEFWQSWNTNMPEEVSPNLAPSSAANPVLAEAVRRLQELYLPERIYLFSSIARGASGPDKPRKRNDSMPVDQRETLSLRELP